MSTAEMVDVNLGCHGGGGGGVDGGADANHQPPLPWQRRRSIVALSHAIND